MANFRDLKVQFGVGDYHLNRFRVVFTPPPGKGAHMLAADFVTRFPHYFTSNYANVTFQSQTFNGMATLRFHGFIRVYGHDIAAPHHDWVAQQWINPNIGFTAQTLERHFSDGDDAIPDMATKAATDRIKDPASIFLPGVYPAAGAAIVAAQEGKAVNRRHFLAGRRSWKLATGTEFGLPPSVMVLETAAIERFSAYAYMATNVKNFTENQVPPIWMSNLSNFIRYNSYTQQSQYRPDNWIRDTVDGVTTVDYIRINAPTLESLQANPEYNKVLTLYPSIIDLAARPPAFGESGIAI